MDVEFSDRYPTEKSIKEIESFEGDFKALAALLMEDLPKWCEAMGLPSCRVNERVWDDEDVFEVEFHTHGWSGAEDIVGAFHKTGKGLLNFFFLARWERGGHYYYEIPKSIFETQPPKADMKEEK